MATVEAVSGHKEVVALKHQEKVTPGDGDTITPGGSPGGEVVKLPRGNVIMTPVGIIFIVIRTPEGQGCSHQVNGFLCLTICHFFLLPPFFCTG